MTTRTTHLQAGPTSTPLNSFRLKAGLPLFLGLSLSLAAPLAPARATPILGPDRFPQFRNLSGLAGGGYGVDFNGYSSLSGPTSLSSPVAHVLGHDQFRLGIASSPYISNSFSNIFNTSQTNGTYTLTYGHTFANRFNVTATDMVLSNEGDSAFNFQAQYIPRQKAGAAAPRLIGSLGVQDIGGGGGSSGEGYPGDTKNSTSVFGVATYRLDLGKKPLYISGGAGTRRFKNGFASASYQVAKPLRLWTEYDGFGINAGVLLTYKRGNHPKSPEFNALLGTLRGKNPVIALGVGF